MLQYSYSVEILELVISVCNPVELKKVSVSVNKELELYEKNDAEKLLGLLAKRNRDISSPIIQASFT